jgi:putative transposase
MYPVKPIPAGRLPRTKGRIRRAASDIPGFSAQAQKLPIEQLLSWKNNLYFKSMESVHTLKFFRRNLPHWLVSDQAYFVTIRLKDSLPRSVIAEIDRETACPEASGNTLEAAQRNRFLKIERLLDARDANNRWLDHPDVADLLIKNLDWLRRQGWVIFAATALSTHMHLLLRSQTGRTSALLDDLRSYKSFTAHEANRILRRTGSFWAREGFDHWIRTAEKFERTVRYIAKNPVKAGRVANWSDWKWTVIDDRVREFLP